MTDGFLSWESFEALKNPLKHIYLDFNILVAIEIHCVEQISDFFSSKNLIFFPLNKERHEQLGWHWGE